MADVTIITLSRNLGYFEQLCGCLREQEGVEFSYDKILVNNAGTVGLTAAALRDNWMVVEPGYNTSYAAGNNMAARIASGKHLLLLNDDVRPYPSFLMQLYEYAFGTDILGALLLNGDGTVNHAGTLVEEGGRTDHIGRGAPRDEHAGKFYPVPAVTFAAAMLDHERWKALGGLSERYYYGWEDTDYCMRAIESGAIVKCCTWAEAIHDECGTRPRHGSNDEVNCRTFLAAWQMRLPALLADYCRRMGPETVKGV